MKQTDFRDVPDELWERIATQQIGKLCELRKCQCLAADALRKSHLPKCFYNRILAD